MKKTEPIICDHEYLIDLIDLDSVETLLAELAIVNQQIKEGKEKFSGVETTGYGQSTLVIKTWSRRKTQR